MPDVISEIARLQMEGSSHSLNDSKVSMKYCMSRLVVNVFILKPNGNVCLSFSSLAILHRKLSLPVSLQCCAFLFTGGKSERS